jgi:hypothetical protein
MKFSTFHLRKVFDIQLSDVRPNGFSEADTRTYILISPTELVECIFQRWHSARGVVSFEFKAFFIASTIHSMKFRGRSFKSLNS